MLVALNIPSSTSADPMTVGPSDGFRMCALEDIFTLHACNRLVWF